MSPLHGQAGCTTASIFVSMALSLINGSRVCLTHMDFSSSVIKNYFSIPVEQDVTTSLTQVTKLIETRSIKMDDILDYTFQIIPNLYLYSTFHPNNIEDNLFFEAYKFLIENMSVFDNIVIDYDYGISSEMLNKCVNLSDCVIVVLNQNNYLIERGIQIVEQIKSMSSREDKKIIYLINRYLPDVLSYKSIASKLNIKSKEILTLSYSPYLLKCSNKKVIEECFISAANNDVRTAPLKFDMQRACKLIANSNKL